MAEHKNSLLISSSEDLEGVKTKDLPFFHVNYDPFNALESWDYAIENELSTANLESVVNMNAEAINQGFFRAEDSKNKKLYINDICIQACLLSYREILSEQKNVIDSIHLIDVQDLTNISALFEGYGHKEKRKFKDSVIFSGYFFNRVVGEYAAQDFTGARSKYRNFDIYLSKDIAPELIKGSVRTDTPISIHFQHKTGYAIFEFDFKNHQTKLSCDNILIPTDFPHFTMFSDLLEKDQPFKDRQFLNFHFPMDYRALVFPLIKVNEINVKKNDGSIHTYSHKTQNVEGYRKEINQHLRLKK